MTTWQFALEGAYYCIAERSVTLHTTRRGGSPSSIEGLSKWHMIYLIMIGTFLFNYSFIYFRGVNTITKVNEMKERNRCYYCEIILGVSCVQLLSSRELWYKISSCAWPAPRFRTIFYCNITFIWFCVFAFWKCLSTHAIFWLYLSLFLERFYVKGSAKILKFVLPKYRSKLSKITALT